MSFRFLILLLLMNGCSSKYAIPVNIAASWFGNIAIHEGAHALAASGLGASSIEVSVLPEKDSYGHVHLGLTTATYDREISRFDETIFLTVGPTSTLLAHIGFGELNRSGLVPRPLQPLIGWLDFGAGISTYAHSLMGISRMSGADLGEQNILIPILLFGIQLTYDIYRIGMSEGGFEKYFNVLFGEDYY